VATNSETAFETNSHSLFSQHCHQWHIDMDVDPTKGLDLVSGMGVPLRQSAIRTKRRFSASLRSHRVTPLRILQLQIRSLSVAKVSRISRQGCIVAGRYSPTTILEYLYKELPASASWTCILSAGCTVPSQKKSCEVEGFKQPQTASVYAHGACESRGGPYVGASASVLPPWHPEHLDAVPEEAPRTVAGWALSTN
jgi:hypothetical protein